LPPRPGLRANLPQFSLLVGDVVHPSWRASSVGVYRLWRDLGYAIGSLVAGAAADALGLSTAMWLVAGLTFASGVVVAAEVRYKAPMRTVTVLLDVRTPPEYAEHHIDGAANIPVDELVARSTEIERLTGSDKAKPIVVYCHSGKRAARAKMLLLEAGYQQVTNLGGIDDWDRQ